MVEGSHEWAALIDKMQHIADIDLCETIENGMIDGFIATRIAERPAGLRSCCKNIRPNFSEGYERY
jgi:hypothetical protein